MNARQKAKYYKRKYNEVKKPVFPVYRTVGTADLTVSRFIPDEVSEDPENFARFKEFVAGDFAKELVELANWEVIECRQTPYDRPRKYIRADIKVVKDYGAISVIEPYPEPMTLSRGKVR